MNDPVDVAIVGAGPYGLSLAAHLRHAGVSFRQFGQPMGLWQHKMPRGMYLKSQGFASNLSDPKRTHTLKKFCAATGRPYADYGKPVSLDTFLAYGAWFRREQAPDVEEVLVTDITQRGTGYELALADGNTMRARSVVVATGVEHFPTVPATLSGLPSTVCTHASEHDDLSKLSGRDVVVVGAGQSALESATLLYESGAKVRVIVRAPRVLWNGELLPGRRSLWQRLREPESGLGSGWGTWFYSTQPSLFRHLPENTRVYRARTALGPAGAWWLRARVEGKFPVLVNHEIKAVETTAHGVRLCVKVGGQHDMEMTADHIIAGTGYRPDLGRLRFLNEPLRSRIQTVAGTPAVGPDFQSSVPGLYFIGPLVAPTFGPVMRFVYGADFAVRTVSRPLIASASAARSKAAAGVTK